MTINEILKVTSGKILSGIDPDYDIKRFVIDSRDIKKGDMFIAINGRNLDGHKYIDSNLLNNVSGIMIEVDIDIDIPEDIALIKVKDTKKALGEISKYHRMKHDIPLIAVTGSAGKTMTKELISLMLEEKYNVLKSDGNKNNHIGLPMTLLNLNDYHEIIVTELGMNHKGEISYLSNICKPNVGVITNIGSAHIGNLKSKKNIYKAKMEITKGMKNGILILNGDDEYLKKVKCRKIDIRKCGIVNPSDLIGKIIKEDINSTEFTLKIEEKDYKFKLNIPGKYLVYNCLLSIATAYMFGISIPHMIKVIKEYKPLSNRMNIIKFEDNILIDDCYNSSYESLIGILSLIEKDNRNKILILGDILELGKYSEDIHKKIDEKLKQIKKKKVLLVGNETKVIVGKHFKDVEEITSYLKKLVINDSIILIKGSRKIGLENIKDIILNK